MRKHLLLSFFLLINIAGFAQTDTIRVASYNILRYGRPLANRYQLKNTHLQPILNTIKPDLIGFNEIDTTITGILDTLNKAMPYAMNHGPEYNTTNTDIIDALFWKSGKFRLLHDTVICNYVRDIVAYDLYYDDPLLGSQHDTIKLTVITAHLKSSNGVPDRGLRDTETRRVIRYLDRLNDTLNIVMMGDFNLYKSTEAAYQNLTAPANTLSRLNDPINRPGNWDGQVAFADVHTQSPRVVQLSDEGASGGLDSRFDFVLLSDAIMNGWKGLRYIPGTYTTFGNDGRHFNRALTDTPSHPTLPPGTIQALYSCSDHLPVYADLTVTPRIIAAPNAIARNSHSPSSVLIANPVGDVIVYQNLTGELLTYTLLSVHGLVLKTGTLGLQSGSIPMPGNATPGMYLFLLRSSDGSTQFRKLIYNQ
jgi:endonuclease/exonuclease/phosphatase family metal-dependent hydrolase